MKSTNLQKYNWNLKPSSFNLCFILPSAIFAPFIKISDMQKEVQKESHIRSLLKGFTWRIIATSTTITIAYFITGEIGDALKIGFIEFVGKIFIYYLHERAWQMAPRGRVSKWFGKKG